jgi:hypothetical protein
LHAVPQPLLLQVAVPLAIPGHTVPHAPQLLVSLLVSTQPAPQRISGKLHWKVQLPPLQTAVALSGGVQALPHFPQLDVALDVSTQEPPQLVRAPQSALQVPALQTVPAAQAVPHALQCSESELRSTHTPLQSVYPELQWTSQPVLPQAA